MSCRSKWWAITFLSQLSNTQYNSGASITSMAATQKQNSEDGSSHESVDFGMSARAAGFSCCPRSAAGFESGGQYSLIAYCVVFPPLALEAPPSIYRNWAAFSPLKYYQ